MLTPDSFQTTTLERHRHGAAVRRILHAAIQAVEPSYAVGKFVQREGDTLWINGSQVRLDQTGRIRVISLGKAAVAMALPLVNLLADYSPDGIIIPKHPPPKPVQGLEIQTGGHPVPDENSLRAGRKVIQYISKLTDNDLVICLISGGGSALLSAPQTGLTLADLQALTTALLRCGAHIDEINTLRRHLDRLKGGGLARLAAPARVFSLILSDVVGNPLEAIASGPTAPDPTSRVDALQILEKYKLINQVPTSIQQTLARAPETVKPGDALFHKVTNTIVGSNLLAARAGLTQAGIEGFQARSLGDAWQGQASKTADEFCSLLAAATESRPLCLVAGGETTVEVKGQGQGGRNQELALAAVSKLAGIDESMFVTLATDGEDGPTDAAGAVVNQDTLERGIALGMSPFAFLENNDSYNYFQRLGDLLKTGPSGTNVNDLAFLFAF